MPRSVANAVALTTLPIGAWPGACRGAVGEFPGRRLWCAPMSGGQRVAL